MNKNIINRINNICESLSNARLLSKVTNSRYNPFDYHCYKISNGINIRYKNVDIYFYKDNYSAYVDLSKMQNIKKIINLSEKIQYDKKRKTISLVNMSYNNELSLLETIIPMLIVL